MRRDSFVFDLENMLDALCGMIYLSDQLVFSFLDARPVAFVDKSLDIIIDPVDQEQMVLMNYSKLFSTVTLARLRKETHKW